MSEGVAEFFSKFQPIDSGKRARIGDPQGEHIGRLRMEFMPLAALAAVDHDSAEYNERDKQSVFYAESWALYHYLQFGRKQKYAPRLSRFWNRSSVGCRYRACVEQLGVSMPALEIGATPVSGQLGFQLLRGHPARGHPADRSAAAYRGVRRRSPRGPGPTAPLPRGTGRSARPLRTRASVDPQQALALARLADQSVTRSPADALALAKRAADVEKRTFISETTGPGRWRGLRTSMPAWSRPARLKEPGGRCYRSIRLRRKPTAGSDRCARMRATWTKR